MRIVDNYMEVFFTISPFKFESKYVIRFLSFLSSELLDQKYRKYLFLNNFIDILSRCYDTYKVIFFVKIHMMKYFIS